MRRFLDRALAGAVVVALSGLGATGALAADKLVIMSHKVHMDVSTQGPGGDVTAEWRTANNTNLEWITLGLDPLRERLFRELSLNATDVNVGFVLNAQATPNIGNLLEPLNSYLEKAPIDKFSDIFPGMVETMSFGGKIYAIPFRHATQGLHYNETYLKERGIDGPPKNVEELISHAKKLTYTRADGTQVSGLVLAAYTHQITLLRAMGGAFITADYKFGSDERALVRYFRTIRELFQAGVLPKGMTTFDQNTPLEWMLQGRVAMVIYPMARNPQMNDKAKSKFPGAIKTVAVPAAAGSGQEVAPGQFEFWAMAIPKNAKNKDRAWSLIRHLSSPENTVREALNGNGPVRASAYDNPQIKQQIAYAGEERRALLNGQPSIPAFDNAPKAADLWKEAFEAAMLGLRSPEETAADLKRRVSPLLP